MDFLGINSFYLDSNSLVIAPTTISDVSSVVLNNAKFDCLYFSTDTDLEQYEDGMPEWETIDEGESEIDITVLRTDFKDTCAADATDFDLSEISYFIIKRREYNSGETFKNIYIQPMDTTSDFTFTYYDKTAASGKTYQYSVVPVIGNTEMDSSKLLATVDSEFDGIYLYDSEGFYGTRMNPSQSYQRNIESNMVTTLNSKYPYMVRNSVLNYGTGSISGIFAEFDSDINEFVFDNGVTYRNGVYDFLTNGNPKLIKFFDGRLVLAMIGNNVTEDQGDVWYAPNVSFDFTEIADASNWEDLQTYGIIDQSLSED